MTRNEAFVLDLASKTDGYLAPGGDVIDELRRAGLVVTQNVGDGFMIVRAVKQRRMRRARNHRWVLSYDRVST